MASAEPPHSFTSTAPLSHDGGDVGVLLCHGFTGSPISLRPWAENLIEAGYTVRLPLLPGHGTSWRDANLTTFDDWFAAVQAELAELIGQCRAVVVAGLSMGGTLTLRLAQTHPEAIAGIVLVNPAVLTLRRAAGLLPVLKYLIPGLKGIAEDIKKPGVQELGYPKTPLKAFDSLRRAWVIVRRDLPKITMPVLLIHSVTDHVVEPINADVVRSGISSADVTDVALENSYHVATLDNDAELIFAEARIFIQRVTGGLS